MGFEVAGRIQKRLVDVSSRVREGQPLLTLNPDDYAQALLAAQDLITAARADMEQSAADARRLKLLAERGVVSQAELQRQQARADVAQAQLDQANRQFALARNRMAYTTLKAPFDGVVTILNAEVGQVVSEGLPVISIAKDDALEISVELPEDMTLANASPQTVFDGRLTGKSATPLKLRLREVAPAATVPLRTFRAMFAILNADLIQSELRIGMSAELTLPQDSGHDGAIHLPATALISTGQDVSVWCVDPEQKKLRRQVVIVKAASDDGVLVDGLQTGQHVVIAGTDKLFADQSVRPIERTGTGYDSAKP
jgi:multidrug efflux system membrane fusion protein